VIWLLIGGIINYMDRAALGVAAPFVKQDLNLSPSELGVIFSTFFFGYAIFAFVGNMMFCGVYYSSQRLLKQRLPSNFLAQFHFWLWQAIIVAAAVTLSYGTASIISYGLNRVLNFRSHENLGRQFPVYVAVSGSNYLIFVLGLTDLLTAVGVYYELSRVIAACCEAVYLYSMMRWVVFRDTTGDAANVAPAASHADAPAAADDMERPAATPSAPAGTD